MQWALGVAVAAEGFWRSSSSKTDKCKSGRVGSAFITFCVAQGVFVVIMQNFDNLRAFLLILELRIVWVEYPYFIANFFPVDKHDEFTFHAMPP